MASPHRARRIHRYTYEAYLENDSSSNVKHEFLEGEIYAMAGGTVEHAVLAMNVGTALSIQLRDKPRLVANSDLKVRVLATDWRPTRMHVDDVCRNVDVPA